jgi:exodeoxyribonuclease III
MERKIGVWYFNNEIFNGKFIDYYYSGRIQSEGILINGKIDGLRKMYFQNGNLSIERYYTNSIPNGLEKEYYEDGTLKQKGSRINGEEDGVWETYFPNGQDPASDKFVYKLHWLKALQDWLGTELQQHPRLALLGDFNIAPTDEDVHDPAAWVGQNLVSPEERNAFKALLDLGLSDSFRLFEQAPKTYSWWDYRMMAFRRNAGMRIDHILLSESLKRDCLSSMVDKKPRSWEQPSDHAPVIAEIGTKE